MKRAILLLATALLGATGCHSRSTCSNQNDLNVFWNTFTDSNGVTFACTDPRSRVVSLQVLVDGTPAILDNANRPQTVPCVPFPGQSSAQGVTLTDFAPGTYNIEVQAFDANGNLIFDDQAPVTIARTCGGTDFNASLVATTGTLTVATTFAGQTTCAGAGVQNFFIELVDSSGTAVPGAESTFVPCVDSAGSLPAFSIPGLSFGQTYTFRTLAGTTQNTAGQQAFQYVRCGVPVVFTGVNPSIQLDLPLAPSGFASCP